MPLSIRPLRPADESLLREMFSHALFVPPGQPLFERAILLEPGIRRYVAGWGREVSLSVQRANRAVTLYQRFGFEVVHEEADTLTMLLRWR